MQNSKLLKLYDFREYNVPPKLLEIPIKQSQIDQALEEVPEHFLIIEEAEDAVKSGDIITIHIYKTEKEEEESIQINVGKNFYDAEWESTLLEKKPGENITLPQRGGNRKGKIIQIKRRIIPRLSDDLIKRMEIENINSIVEYQNYIKERLVGRKRQEKERKLIDVVVKETVKQSEFDDLSKELERELEKVKDKYKEIAKKNELTYEELLNKELPRYLKTMEQKDKYLKEQQLQSIKMMLIGQQYAEEKGVVINIDTYNEMKKMYLDQGVDPQYMEDRYPYDVYMLQARLNCFSEEIAAFYKENFKVEIVNEN